MRFIYAETMTDPHFHIPLAQAAEAAGYRGVTLADSLCYPKESDSKYPFTPDGSREFLEDKAVVEPFILGAAIAQATTTLRLFPFVLKLPVRAPLLVAKQATSLGWLSGGRLSLGVGLSPWPEDFELMGVPWPRRGKRMDECIDIIRGLSSGEYFGYDGQIHQLQPVKLSPVPEQGLPILIGGHSDAALRRAAVRGDGWMHAGGDADELDQMIAKLHQLRQDAGTADKPFEIHAISMDMFSLDGVRRLEDKGVTDLIIGFRMPYQVGPDTEPLQRKIDALNKYSDKIIQRL